MNGMAYTGIVYLLVIVNLILIIVLFLEKRKRKKTRRQYIRLPVNIAPKKFQAIGETDLLLKNKVIIKNIGMSGLAVQTDYNLKKNRKVAVGFVFPDNDKMIEVTGCVMWVGKDFHEGIMGIKFTRINKDDKSLISDFIEAAVNKR